MEVRLGFQYVQPIFFLCRVQFVDEFKLISQKARRGQVRKVDAVQHVDIQPGKSFEPTSMYNVLTVIQNNSAIIIGQQEDAQEFLTCLLNGLNDEMVEVSVHFLFKPILRKW